MDYLIVSIFSYLCGSIPFGLILTKLFTNKDIRKFGSGNIGATNVLRTGNKLLAFLTLVLDCGKGYMPVAMTAILYPDQTQISALMTFLGHIFSIWLKFNGGKGVATYLGILFSFSITLSFLFIFTWLIVALIFKYSSVSSMFATFTVLIVAIIKSNVLKAIDPNFIITTKIDVLLFIFFILIIFTHRKNISNLKHKVEKKIKI